MGMEWRWKSSEKAGHSDLKQCCKVPTARKALKEAASTTHEPTNSNRIQGGERQGERAYDREALVTKGNRRRSGGCVGKSMFLPGEISLVLERATPHGGARSQQRP